MIEMFISINANNVSVLKEQHVNTSDDTMFYKTASSRVKLLSKFQFQITKMSRWHVMHA